MRSHYKGWATYNQRLTEGGVWPLPCGLFLLHLQRLSRRCETGAGEFYDAYDAHV